MDILYLITARGGSKGILGKNLREISGISLVGYKAISARKSKYCSRLIISTDSPEIQENARHYGVEVPFTRPAELATDTATSAQVIAHAIEWVEGAGERYDAIMLLEPSSPFARSFDYDNAVEMMVQSGANAVVGVRPMEVHSVYIRQLDKQRRLSQDIDRLREARRERRQDMPQECTPNGALYLFKWEYFKKHRSIYHEYEKVFGYMMDRFYSIEIDEPIDLYWAEFLVEKGYISLADWK